jgi:oleate hydratase
VEFKRYLVRFTHMVSGFSTLTGIMRTVYNQYDSLVRPLRKWLEERGVKFIFDTTVTDLHLEAIVGGYEVRSILCERQGQQTEIQLAEEDFVFVTLGSMTDASSLGSMDTAPALKGKSDGGAWKLWQRLANGRSGFGVPSNFADHIEQSKWVSFTTTLHDSTFFDRIRDLTGNVPGEGGLITFPESAWLASIVLPHQPHFIDQPANVNVFWGYGLKVDAPGDFIKKPMSACNGREMMTEILGQLKLHAEVDRILSTCICIPCMMPFITSQFLCRSEGDRPPVVPEGSRNLGLIGQYCEQPDDVVFTVEYSIRSAQTAVYTLLQLDRKPPSVYKGNHNPRVLLDAFLTLHGASV